MDSFYWFWMDQNITELTKYMCMYILQKYLRSVKIGFLIYKNTITNMTKSSCSWNQFVREFLSPLLGCHASQQPVFFLATKYLWRFDNRYVGCLQIVDYNCHLEQNTFEDLTRDRMPLDCWLHFSFGHRYMTVSLTATIL